MSAERRDSSWITWLIGPAFLGLAGWFLFGPSYLDIETIASPKIPISALSTTPMRSPLTDPPKIELNGFERTCMECHRVFDSDKHAKGQALVQHAEIKIEHGSHRTCYGCHDRKDRDRLVLLDGSTVGYAQSMNLCAQCHGSTVRDWTAGLHGRTNGYWDSERGEVRRIACIGCHDPHRPREPAMTRLTPLPGPHGLRAEPKKPDHTDHTDHAEPPKDPFLRALERAKEARDR